MQDLIGRIFRLDEHSYIITDVRNISAETMVYAEVVATDSQAQETPARRAAFRFADIESRLETLAEVG